MAIDTKLHLKILEELLIAYPETVNFQSRAEFTEQEFQANLMYLKQRGYIDRAESTEASAVASTRIVWARITVSGIEFLQANMGHSDRWKTMSSLLNNGWVIGIVGGSIGSLALAALLRWLG
jgi:hypothetical protein